MFTHWIADFGDQTRQTIFPAAVAVAAGGALVVTALSASRAAARVKRKDTLEAWVKWSDDTREARRDVLRVLGEEQFTPDQAKALAGDAGDELRDKHNTVLDEAERRKLSDEVHDILNGLERLAVGVRLGIYDVAVLRRMGRTIIALHCERFEPFIKVKQNAKPTTERGSGPYTELAVLYRMIEGPRLIKMLRGRGRSLDAAG
jgi:Domain of unknown function (DUF4760)